MALQDYFDKQVIIQRVTATDNGFGGTIETWNTHLTIDCLIDYIRGQETEIGKQYMDNSTHVLMTNTGYDITITDRVNHNNDIYRIVHVDEPFGKHAEILLELVGVDNV